MLNLNDIIVPKDKLTKEELIKAIRLSIESEYDQILLYSQIIERVDNKKIIDILSDIIEEEKIHVGQLLNVIGIIDKNELQIYSKGIKEANKQ